MRFTLAMVLATVLVGASACGKSASAPGALGGSGGTVAVGDSGGAAQGGSSGGAADSGGAGGQASLGSAGGQYGLQTCEANATTTTTGCACDAQDSPCKAAITANCVGPLCSPSLDQARLVATWPLTAPTPTGAGWVHGDYSECSDGTRSFSVQKNGVVNAFVFDPTGDLAFSNVITDQATSMGAITCIHTLCGASPPGALSCRDCQMALAPAPEGTNPVPSGGSNGPSPACEVDANGRWAMPHLASP